MTGVHEDLSRDDVVRVGSDRGFGFVFAGFFAVVGIIQAIGGRVWSLAWLAAAVVVLLLALLRPSVLHGANLVWFRFGLLLHKVVSPVILGLLFYGAFVPVGFVMRALGKRPCQLDLDRRPGRSHWMPRAQTSAGSFKDQF